MVAGGTEAESFFNWDFLRLWRFLSEPSAGDESGRVELGACAEVRVKSPG